MITRIGAGEDEKSALELYSLGQEQKKVCVCVCGSKGTCTSEQAKAISGSQVGSEETLEGALILL